MIITIVGIGPGDPKWVTAAGKSYASPFGGSDKHIMFAQTSRHAFVQEVMQARKCVCMDDLYEACADFDELNAAIAERLTSQSQDVVYLVPGQGTGLAAINILSALAIQRGHNVTVCPGIGYEVAALAQIPAEKLSGSYCVTSAVDALTRPPAYQSAYIITELNDPITAAELKLVLSRYYPDNWEIYLADTIAGSCRSITLDKLDTLDRSDNVYSHGLCAVIPPIQYESMSEMGFYELEAIMVRLRGENGCPWDREQTHESIRRNLIEEAYETLDAIDEKDCDALCEELGDLLLQVTLHAQIAREHGEFDLRNVCDGVCKKLIHRHPHVFGDIIADTSGVVLKNWENIKLDEKSIRSQTDAMNAVPKAMPALMRAYKIQQKAAHVGFDWDEPEPALDKVIDEVHEIKSANDSDIVKEVGDLLFAAVNASRKYKIDPELALYNASEKFINRFSYIETNSPKPLSEMNLPEMDKLWEDSKNFFP